MTRKIKTPTVMLRTHTWEAYGHTHTRTLIRSIIPFCPATEIARYALMDLDWEGRETYLRELGALKRSCGHTAYRETFGIEIQITWVLMQNGSGYCSPDINLGSRISQIRENLKILRAIMGDNEPRSPEVLREHAYATKSAPFEEIHLKGEIVLVHPDDAARYRETAERHGIAA